MGYMDGSYDTVAPEIRSRLPISFVYTRYPGNTVVQTAPQVVIKYGGTFSEEIKFARFARCKTSLPVPRIIHYPPFTRLVYLYGENPWRLAGQSNRYIDCGTTQSHCLPAEVHLGTATLCRVISNSRVRFRGGLIAMSFSHPETREMLKFFCTEQYTESLLFRIPRNAAIKLTHGDRRSKNIIVEGSRITGIVD